MGGSLGDAFRDASFEPGQEELEAVALLNFFDEFVCRELTAHHQDQLLDGIFSAVDVEESAHNDRKSRRVDLKVVKGSAFNLNS